MRRKLLIIHRLAILNFTVILAGGMLILFLSFLSNASAASNDSHSDRRILNDIFSERWKIFADMQKERADPGVIAYNEKIYVMGGYFPFGFGYNQTQEVYDPQTHTWQFAANLPSFGRSDMMLANVGDKIYAIGGWNMDHGGQYTHTQRYDPMADNWITMTSMITPVSGAGVVVVTDTVFPTGTIYILGGASHSGSIAAVQKYNPISDTWSLGTPMTVARSELGAVLLNGKIYAMGGVTSGGVTTSTVEIYYPISDTWKIGPPLPEARASIAVGVRQGEIYVVGGTNNWALGNPTSTAFVFDPGTGIWSMVNPMPVPRSATRGAVISDTLYVIGGKGDSSAGFANEGFGFPPVISTVKIDSDNPDPSQINQPFTVTYAVSGTGVIPSGIVTVSVDNRPERCNGSVINGMGSCQMALNTLGAYTLTAAYGGNYILLSSASNPVSHSVVKASTNTTITAINPEPAFIGQPIAVTYTVTSPFGMPTGSVLVTASDSLENCSGGLTNGSGNCLLTFNTHGTYTLTAAYSGDANFNPSNASKSHAVTKIDTTTSITSDNPDPSIVNQPISVTFAVTSPFGIPTGPLTISVSNSHLTCSNLLVNGAGDCALVFPSPGAYTLNAQYNGDATFLPSSDSELHLVAPHKLFLPITTR
jgi:N-acetylneuraminic acid mutarotase